MAFTFVTIQATYDTADGRPAQGKITFEPIDQMQNGISIAAAPVSDDLDASGAMSVLLAATDDLGTTPPGVTYRVTEQIVGQDTRIYYVSVPHGGGSVQQLADLPRGLTGGGGSGGYTLRNATDYDDSVAPTTGQAIVWSGTKYHPATVSGGTGAVSSVNGATGAVSVTPANIGAQPIDSDLTAIAALAPTDGSFLGRQAGVWAARTPTQAKTDLALDQVNNTSDASKPISTATASALAGKAATVHTHTVADISATGTPSASTFLRGDGAWAAGAGVTSVNGLSGAVTLGADAIAEGATHLFLTPAERASLAAGGTDAIARATAWAGLLAADTFTRPDASTPGTQLETGQTIEMQAGTAAISGNRLTSSVAFILAADIGKADQEVTCKITVAAGTASSVCFRMGPTSADRLQISLDTTNGFRLSKVDTGTLTALETTAMTFTAGQTYEVRAVVIGSVITCYIDGSSPLPQHTLTTAEQTKYGAYTRIGVRQTSTTPTFFEDLRARIPYPSGSGGGLPSGSFSVYLATGDDSNLTAALASVPAGATLVAVTVAGS